MRPKITRNQLSNYKYIIRTSHDYYITKLDPKAYYNSGIYGWNYHATPLSYDIMLVGGYRTPKSLYDYELDQQLKKDIDKGIEKLNDKGDYTLESKKKMLEVAFNKYANDVIEKHKII